MTAENGVLFGASFLDGRSEERVDERNFGELIPTITELAVETVSPAAPLFEVPFTVDAEAWSASFQLMVDGSATVALRVYDAMGLCVGYDSGRGGVVTEFAGTYTAAGSATQVVEIPVAGGQTYTVQAVLERASSDQPVGVQLWALETPARPAVMTVLPTEHTVQADYDEEVVFTVSVGESGGQLPVDDVVVALGPVTGPAAAELPIVSLSEYAVGTVAAGTFPRRRVRAQCPARHAGRHVYRHRDDHVVECGHAGGRAHGRRECAGRCR